MSINEEWPWQRRNFRNVLNLQVTIYTACKFHKNMRAYLHIISDTFYYGLYSYVLLVMDCHGTPQVSLASSAVAAACCCTVLLFLALLLHYITYNRLYVYRTRICVLHGNSYCCSNRLEPKPALLPLSCDETWWSVGNYWHKAVPACPETSIFARYSGDFGVIHKSSPICWDPTFKDVQHLQETWHLNFHFMLHGATRAPILRSFFHDALRS